MWGSVVSLPRHGTPTLPFEAMDPNMGNYVTIRSVQDVHRLFNSWQWDEGKESERPNEARFEYARMAGVGHMLLEPAFQDLIKRKRYCERFNCPAFPGTYDDQPQWWKDAVVAMDNAETEATNYLRRKHG